MSNARGHTHLFSDSYQRGAGLGPLLSCSQMFRPKFSTRSHKPGDQAKSPGHPQGWLCSSKNFDRRWWWLQQGGRQHYAQMFERYVNNGSYGLLIVLSCAQVYHVYECNLTTISPQFQCASFVSSPRRWPLSSPPIDLPVIPPSLVFHWVSHLCLSD